jgi:hypothetical protein
LRDESKSKRILNILSPPTAEIKCSPFEDVEIRFRIEEVSFYHTDRGANQYKREGVGNPKRFMLAFRDTIMSRGEVLLTRSDRARSRLLNQNRGLLRSSTTRQSLQASSSGGPGNVNLSHEEAEIEVHQSSHGLCDGCPTTDDSIEVVQEEEQATEETINMIEQGAVCSLEES